MDDNRALAEKGWNAYYAHDLDTCLSLYAEDAEVVLPGMPPVKGKAAIRATWEMYQAAFPDEKPTRMRHVVDGNTVVSEWESVATHTGALPMPTGETLPATGRTVVTQGATVQDIQNGLMKRQVFYFDNAAFLAQLGLMPEMAAPAG